jgi:hypothetical protein
MNGFEIFIKYIKRDIDFDSTIKEFFKGNARLFICPYIFNITNEEFKEQAKEKGYKVWDAYTSKGVYVRKIMDKEEAL